MCQQQLGCCLCRLGCPLTLAVASPFTPTVSLKSYCFSVQGSLGGKVLCLKRQTISIMYLLQKSSFA